MLKVKRALIRAVRTFCQVAAASILGIPAITAITGGAVVGLGMALAVVGVNAGLAGLVSFLQNIAEDNTSVDIPKG